jgi:hypothetical protein
VRIVVIGGSGHVGRFMFPIGPRRDQVVNLSRRVRSPYVDDTAWTEIEVKGVPVTDLACTSNPTNVRSFPTEASRNLWLYRTIQHDHRQPEPVIATSTSHGFQGQPWSARQGEGRVGSLRR